MLRFFPCGRIFGGISMVRSPHLETPVSACMVAPALRKITVEMLLSAYAQGVFPMGDPDGHIRWYTADPRGVLPLDQFHVPRSLRKVIQSGKFTTRINHDFRATMIGCMSNRKESTWITDELIEAYGRLHDLGFAHSVETYLNGELVGGLYGVSLGSAFFGESMFFRVSDASKVALAALVERLREREFLLLDTQAVTRHLSMFGCIEVPSGEYQILLRGALTQQRVFHP
jgi:leucyl/phenylalanyl-tRNA---protein transferase